MTDEKDSETIKANMSSRFVNEYQDKEERSFKYLLAKVLGVGECNSRRIRDFTWSHYLLFLHGQHMVVNE